MLNMHVFIVNKWEVGLLAHQAVEAEDPLHPITAGRTSYEDGSAAPASLLRPCSSSLFPKQSDSVRHHLEFSRDVLACAICRSVCLPASQCFAFKLENTL